MKAMRRARSLMVVPLVGRAKILGVLSFASVRSGRLFDLTDLSAAIALASRGALALEMSRLCRETSEAMRQRGADLSRLSHDLKNVLRSVSVVRLTLMRTFLRSWESLDRSAPRWRSPSPASQQRCYISSASAPRGGRSPPEIRHIEEAT